jgi:hypothetical protein
MLIWAHRRKTPSVFRGDRAIRSNSSAPAGPAVFPLLSLALFGCLKILFQNSKFGFLHGLFQGKTGLKFSGGEMRFT